MTMVKIMFCLRRRAGLSPEEFQRYWREDHAGLVRSKARTLGIQRYVQSHTLFDPALGRLASARGFDGEAFDGVAELWFDSVYVLTDDRPPPPAAAAAATALLEDEAAFIDLARSPIFVVAENEVIAPNL